ncbi:uncharacterized protein VTP21DRAFT_275 [Calcarisporiella thermophila]|uniref:uncharacterized protein n=1 Tax=Calcarisporiella thermophila TaxID=911321 RepID=UPI0037426575
MGLAIPLTTTTLSDNSVHPYVSALRRTHNFHDESLRSFEGRGEISLENLTESVYTVEQTPTTFLAACSAKLADELNPFENSFSSGSESVKDTTAITSPSLNSEVVRVQQDARPSLPALASVIDGRQTCSFSSGERSRKDMVASPMLPALQSTIGLEEPIPLFSTLPQRSLQSSATTASLSAPFGSLVSSANFQSCAPTIFASSKEKISSTETIVSNPKLLKDVGKEGMQLPQLMGPGDDARPVAAINMESTGNSSVKLEPSTLGADSVEPIGRGTKAENECEETVQSCTRSGKEFENSKIKRRKTLANVKISPVGSEEKRRIVLEKNRQSAQKCRQRKKKYVADLQKSVHQLTSENTQLKNKTTSLREEIVRLKALLLSHQDCPLYKSQEFGLDIFALMGNTKLYHC